jgi:small subunit ribosomal protein S14
MAKKSQINRDNRRRQLIAKYAERRAALRKTLKDPNASFDAKLEAQNAFAKLPRNSCPTRKNNRCAISGRSKAYYNKFGISRIALRELALRGQLPGVRKSSW